MMNTQELSHTLMCCSPDAPQRDMLWFASSPTQDVASRSAATTLSQRTVKLTVSTIAVLIIWSSLLSPAQAQTGVEVITNSIGMKLALIPDGSFVMGSPRGEAEREAVEIRHDVHVTKPFYMGVYEVTQAEYQQLMPSDDRNNPVFNDDRGGGPDHPMENVTWESATEFCKLLTKRAQERQAGRKYRLPTEAEWEYACRAGTKTVFHFGDSLSSDQANFNGRYPYGDARQGPYLRRTAKVGSYKPNAFGLYDMHGNVAEWCADWFDPEYYDNSPEEDPLGPPFGVLSDGYEKFYLVVRGGCWLDDARACRSAYRYRSMLRSPNRLVGFRVVCDVEGSAAGE